ncbi:MAG: ABC transporter ATP-binding protein [Synergistaceae bacterium]|nr:ABC transporter ATP-binding protein [Synergistaceae bacterium]
MAALICSGLSVAYGGREALSGVSFELPRGAFLAVVGENGSGKSTLVRTLLGLIKPSAGTARLDGGLTRRDIGYLPQQRESRGDFPATVYEITISGRLGRLGARPFYSGEDRREAEKNLRLTGLWELRSRAFRELSGGQQQRTLLARALCAEGGLLLLDEPVSGLDADAADQMYHLLRELKEKKKTTIVMVTHDLPRAAEAASHILELDGGQRYFGESASWPGRKARRNGND